MCCVRVHIHFAKFVALFCVFNWSYHDNVYANNGNQISNHSKLSKQ